LAAPLVSLRDVHRSYARGNEVVNALRGVSFDVGAAEFVVISGPSGSGKSTLLHVMAGLDRPNAGEVSLEGTPISQMPDDELTLYRRRRLGFIFQFFHLLRRCRPSTTSPFLCCWTESRRATPSSSRASALTPSASAPGRDTVRVSCPAASSSAWR